MRKIVAYLLTSVDGVVEAPDRYARAELFPDLVGLIGELISDQDTVLFGRRTYDAWSGHWPASKVQPFADFINSVPKRVFTSHPLDTPWANTIRVSGELGPEIRKMKRSPGGVIGVHGSVTLIETLLRQGLLDELRLSVLPCIAGAGRRLAVGPNVLQLELTQARTTEGGVQLLTYRPPGPS